MALPNIAIPPPSPPMAGKTRAATAAAAAAAARQEPPSPPPDLRSEASFAASRRRRTGQRQRRRTAPASFFLHLPSQQAAPTPARNILLDLNQPAPDFGQNVEGLRFLLKKELRNSDVGSLGRIVLPKKEAEIHLPTLTARDGISLSMNDLETAQTWTFKYRFWPNNKSRMYILENTGNFIKVHGLGLGDFILVYKDDLTDKYVIRAKKVADQESPLPPTDDGVFDSIVPDFVVHSARYSDLFLPLADGMNMAVGLNLAFSADFTMGFTDDIMGNYSVQSLPRLGSLESLSLDDDDFL